MDRTLLPQKTKKFFLRPGQTAQILPLNESEEKPEQNSVRFLHTPDKGDRQISNRCSIRFAGINLIKPVPPLSRNLKTPRGSLKIAKNTNPRKMINERRISPKASVYVLMDRNSSLPMLSQPSKKMADFTPVTIQLSNLNDREIKFIASNPGCINVITTNNQFLTADTIINEERNSLVSFSTPPSFDLFEVLSIDCGAQHKVACVLKDKQFYVFGSGDNSYGQLGLGKNIKDYSTSFKIIKFPNVFRFCQVCCGSFFTMLLSDTSSVWVFGHNNHGQLGLGQKSENVFEPTFCEPLKGVPVSSLAAGTTHSLALTSTGIVFAAGNNAQGQLGITSQSDQLVFTTIDSFANVHIVYIAAYACYSAAIDEFGTLYVWGGKWGPVPNILSYESDNDQLEKVVDVALGQDGRIAVLTARNKLIISGYYVNDDMINIPVDITSPSSPFVKLYSGGEYFFAVTSSSQQLPLISKENTSSRLLLPPTTNNSKDKEKSSREIRNIYRPVFNILILNPSHFPGILTMPAAPLILKLVFSSPSTLNASFLLDNFSEDMTSVSSGIDIGSVISAYGFLMKKKDLLNVVNNAFNNLLENLLQFPPYIKRPTTMRFLILGLLYPSPIDYRSSYLLWEHLVYMIGKMNAYSVLTQWLSVLCQAELEKILQSLKDYITINAAEKKQLYSESMRMAVKALEIVWFASNRTKKISFEKFYHYTINEMVDLKVDYDLYCNDSFSFTKFAPWMLNADSKTKFLREVSKSMQFEQQKEALLENLTLVGNIPVLSSNISPEDLFFILTIKRDNILQDTFKQIGNLKHPEIQLKKPLKVKFENEPAVDEGGVQREFFELIVNQLIDPSLNLFVQYNDFYWFNKSSKDPNFSQFYLLTGTIVGLAIYNGNLINIRFPTVVYKKLKGQTVTFNDLKELDPQLYTTLQNILSYEGDVENDMCLTFDYEGVPLKENGLDIPVTNNNREEYIDAVTRYILDKSIFSQFKSFKEGFLKVTGNIVLPLFNPEELSLLVAGREELDFYALMKVTKYESGYTAESPTVQAFWRIVFNRLTETEKKKLLYFVTASPRAPIGGLGSVPFIISRDGDSNHIPTSHTCFFMLVLPDEPDEEKLYQKLKIAIENSEGFAFK